MKMENEPEHIILLPMMAQGHIRPFLSLAHRLTSTTTTTHRGRNFTVTLLTTPLNAANIVQNHHLPSTIKVHSLPFSSTDHNLPSGVENTDKVPLPLLISLFHASASLQPHVHNFLLSLPSPPLCIIFDVFLSWAADVSRSVGSTPIAFTTGGAYGTAAYISIWNHLPHRDNNKNNNNNNDNSNDHVVHEDAEFAVQGFPASHRFRRSQLHKFMRNADGSDDWSRFFQTQIRLSKKCSGWLCNSVEEIEPLGFDILRNYLQLPVWGIGPLIASPDGGERLTGGCHECVKWLSTQKQDSVLYVSFGSQNTVSPTQMMELAAGLELSGRPFVWVIRPPFGFDMNGEFRPEWLPDGFEKRVRERNQGMLVHKWGPQVEILRHEMTGGFLSHCGWNSVLEGVREGVPIIGWPLAGEQAYNSKMMEEEMGVAVELAWGLEGKVSRNDVKRVVGMVLEKEEGSRGCEMKKKAVEMGVRWKDALREEGEFKASSVKAMDDFIDAVVSKRCKESI